MSRFKVGQTVYMGRGDNQKEMIVARVINNPMIPIRQYSFEAPNDGFACGEQSIRATPTGTNLKISDCIRDTSDEIATRINTIANATRNSINGDDLGYGVIMSETDVFFRPNMEFCEWLKNHANGRLIIDVGCGQGHLVRMLKMVGAKAIGIEPNFNQRAWLKMRMVRDSEIPDVNEILGRGIEDCKNLIKGFGANGALLVFARPCHTDFVEVGIRNMPKGMEALYITLPENIKEYNDLGEFILNAELIEHKGTSEDDEVVLTVKR